jgi:hypothetical protein
LVERIEEECGCVNAQERESIRVRIVESDRGCVAELDTREYRRLPPPRLCRWSSRYEAIQSTWVDCMHGARELGVIVLLVATFLGFAWAIGSMIVFAESPQVGPLQPLRALLGLLATGMFGFTFLCALDRRWRGPLAQLRHLGVRLRRPREEGAAGAARLLEGLALQRWREFDPTPIEDDAIDDPYR